MTLRTRKLLPITSQLLIRYIHATKLPAPSAFSHSLCKLACFPIFAEFHLNKFHVTNWVCIFYTLFLTMSRLVYYYTTLKFIHWQYEQQMSRWQQFVLLSLRPAFKEITTRRNFHNKEIASNGVIITNKEPFKTKVEIDQYFKCNKTKCLD